MQLTDKSSAKSSPRSSSGRAISIAVALTASLLVHIYLREVVSWLAIATSHTEVTYTVTPTIAINFEGGRLESSLPVLQADVECAPAFEAIDGHSPGLAVSGVSVACKFVYVDSLADPEIRAVAARAAKEFLFENFRPVPGISSEVIDFSYSERQKSRLMGVSIDVATLIIFALVGAGLSLSVGVNWKSELRSVRAAMSAPILAVVLVLLDPLLGLLLASYDNLIALIRGFDHHPFSSNVTSYQLLVSVVLAPLGEELVYRSWMIRLLTPRTGTLMAVLVSSVLFMFGHEGLGISQMFWVFLGGLALGVLWSRFNSLTLCVLSHAATNLLVLANR